MCGVRKLTRTAYAISAYDALQEIGKISTIRRNAMIALREQSRGVLSSFMFYCGRLPMPLARRE